MAVQGHIKKRSKHLNKTSLKITASAKAYIKLI